MEKLMPIKVNLITLALLRRFLTDVRRMNDAGFFSWDIYVYNIMMNTYGDLKIIDFLDMRYHNPLIDDGCPDSYFESPSPSGEECAKSN